MIGSGITNPDFSQWADIVMTLASNRRTGPDALFRRRSITIDPSRFTADFRRPEIDPHFEAEIGEIRAFLRGQCVMISHSEGSFSVGQT
jgi:hypothetical protein